MKHTQGEWKLTQRGDVFDIDSDEWGIATVYGNINHTGKGPGPESAANAKLIIAAPELLEALQNLVYGRNLNIDFESISDKFSYQSALKSAKAAIKKATE